MLLVACTPNVLLQAFKYLLCLVQLYILTCFLCCFLPASFSKRWRLPFCVCTLRFVNTSSDGWLMHTQHSGFQQSVKKKNTARQIHFAAVPSLTLTTLSPLHHLSQKGQVKQPGAADVRTTTARTCPLAHSDSFP